MSAHQTEFDQPATVCLLCEYGLCFRGCWSPRCECRSQEHVVSSPGGES